MLPIDKRFSSFTLESLSNLEIAKHKSYNDINVPYNQVYMEHNTFV